MNEAPKIFQRYNTIGCPTSHPINFNDRFFDKFDRNTIYPMWNEHHARIYIFQERVRCLINFSRIQYTSACTYTLKKNLATRLQLLQRRCCVTKKVCSSKTNVAERVKKSTQSWTRSWNELFFEVFNKSENCSKFGLLKIPVASSRIHMMKFPSGIMYLFAALGYLGSCVFKVECMQ